MLEWRVSPEGPAAEGELPGVVVVGDEVQVDQHQEEDRGRGHEEEEQQPQGDRLHQGSVSTLLYALTTLNGDAFFLLLRVFGRLLPFLESYKCYQIFSMGTTIQQCS